ncbi:MAG: TetR/AcrR family transcriptional regulator [Nitrospirota bacterium]|nr:TetR/AcrR family transcriptional regulator [Nitrospirota bacterium]
MTTKSKTSKAVSKRAVGKSSGGGAKKGVRGPTGPGVDTRKRLVDAARKFLREQGYAATSPRELQEAAGIGQGSFYHHFESKEALMEAALEEVSAEMMAEVDRAFDRAKPPMQRVRDFLLAPRDHARNGCRLGRLAFDPGMDHPAVAKPVAAYMAYVEGFLVESLAEARRGGDLPAALDVEAVAEAILAVVQGGFVLSRVHRDGAALDGAVRGLLGLFDLAAPERKKG